MAAKKPRQTRDPVTWRFESVLTQALVDQLCETHDKGRDFRNVTAARCKVNPKLLSRWLRMGSEDETGSLHAELFVRMLAIEGEIRAGYIAEVENPLASTEESTYEGGKLVGKTVTSRSTRGIQWLMEKRFAQFRVEHIAKVDELEVMTLLEPAAIVYSADMVLSIVQQMAANPERLPEAVRVLFARTDWRVPKEMTDGQATH